jgi:hypothetical protein
MKRANQQIIVIKGIDGKGISSASYNASTGVLTITFTDASTYQTGDLRGANGTNGADGKGISSTSYNPATGVLTITFTDASTYQTGDLRGANGTNGVDGKGISSTSYNASTGVLTITFTDASTYQTGDLRGSVSFGTSAGTACEGNDSRLTDARKPTDSSVTYGKVADALKTFATVTSSIDLSANGGGMITLTANTAFSFTGFELNKSYLLIITANGFTPSWANAAKHIPVTGNEAFATSGVFYVNLTCIDATSGSEKLLTTIMKGA